MNRTWWRSVIITVLLYAVVVGSTSIVASTRTATAVSDVGRAGQQMEAAQNPFTTAQGQLSDVRKAAKVGEASLETTIGRIIKSALSLLGVFFFGYMVWAGYLWMTAHGEEERITKAKKMITNAVIGLAITLGAYAVTIFIVSRLTFSAGITP